MRNISCTVKHFPEIYDKAVSFRFLPTYDKLINRNWHLLHKKLITILHQVHIEMEDLLLERGFDNWPTFFNSAINSPSFGKNFHLINYFINFKNLLRNKLTVRRMINCNHPSFYNCLNFNSMSNQSQLYLLLPFIVYNLPIPEYLYDYYPIKGKDEIKVFCELWGAKVDINYSESAPAKILET